MSRLHPIWLRFPGRLARHPLLRALLAVLGVAVLAGLLVFALAAGAAMIVAGLVLRLLFKRRQRAAPGVIEGEYEVVPASKLSLSR